MDVGMKWTPGRAAVALASAVAVLSPVVIVASPAASAAPHHRTLTFMASDPVGGVNDGGNPGSTSGDVRTYSLKLSTPAGAKVGRANIVMIQTYRDAGVDTALQTSVLTIPGGAITCQGLLRFSDMTDMKQRPLDKVTTIAITGGTGKYVGADGYVTFEILPNFASKWVVHLI